MRMKLNYEATNNEDEVKLFEATNVEDEIKLFQATNV